MKDLETWLNDRLGESLGLAVHSSLWILTALVSGYLLLFLAVLGSKGLTWILSNL